MEQFEQLLTCAICLDRYRNPKLLPCQHSFCMEPCMEGLVDYVRRQVKCPECRAEHRIPYQGVQAFPTNVTLQRFLELHIEISGELPDPTAGQMMERCAVCSEKAYCNLCVHCDKRICPECRSAHMDILRREIARINNQIRRGIHRLQDALSMVEKNTLALKSNCGSVNEEIEEINRRLAKALKDRTEHLKNDMDRYLTSEMRTLDTLRENLEQEIGNIQSNCDLADKHMTEVATAEWDDRELMDAKEIFLRTVEFIRNFEYGDNQDWSRRVRFVMAHDPNQLVLHVAGYGDLNVSHASGGSTPGLLQPPSSQGLGSSAGLMRSKSDHRLAYRQQLEESGRYGDQQENEPVLGGRRFGERPATRETPRYGRTSTTDYGDYGDPYDDGSSRPTRSRFRSRFARHQDNDSDTETNTRSVVRFSDHQTPAPKEREKVLDTEDVARGPLSGISRLCDSPRVMKRLQEGIKKKEAPPPPPVYQPPKVTAAPPRRTSQTTPPVTQRQMSEDDEIARIKKQNKATTSTQAEPERPVSERVAALKQKSEDRDDRTRGSPTRQRSQTQEVSSEAESDESAPSSLQQRKSTPVTTASRRSSTPSDQGTPASRAKATRSTSSDSTASSSDGSAVRNTAPPSTPPTPSTPTNTKTEKPQFQSRFLPATRPSTTPVKNDKDDEDETSTESSSEEEETDSSEEEDIPTKKENQTNQTNNTKEMAKTDIGPLLARSAQARDFNPKPVEEPTSRPYTSRFLNKSRSTAVMDDEPISSRNNEEEPKYPSGRSRYAALKDRRTRLARSRSTHNLGDDDIDDIDEPMSPTTQSPSAYLASRGYGRLARTRSSHKLDDPDEELDEPPVAPIRSKESKSQKTNDPNAYLAAKGYASAGTDLSRSRSSHALKSRESSPDRPLATTERDGAALSSWARYLKSKYGNRSSGSTGTGSSSSASNVSGGDTSRRLSLGLSLHGNDHDSESKNTPGSPSPHRTAQQAQAQQAAQAGIAAGSCPRSQYLQKRRQLYCIGGRGSEPGFFTWPRGVAVAPDNSIVVADSSNHRVQVFDQHGNFLHEFGTYGSGDGEFDCLAGVAVNRIGQYIIADRYNHRVQVFDPSGRFLRAFGSQGSSDGRFNYPWGVTTDALGFIYVCDKENHRVQVFQSDGTFVGKFGSCGSRSGQLDHPHYIAVSSTNRVVVSDSNNHRIQIFDVNGRVLSSFGSEGAEEGQFKFPRGVAVDDQGYICVADSGNNRIQIFQPDGTFLRAFGCWGSGEAEFKGLEGVAVGNNGNIIVCDRENHRIQVF